MRRVLLLLLVGLLVLVGLGVAKVEHDRRQCPPGPWAHPLDRIKRGEHSYKFAC